MILYIFFDDYLSNVQNCFVYAARPVIVQWSWFMVYGLWSMVYSLWLLATGQPMWG